ncbi:MAG: MarR family transcriptional regulator [Hyphomonadaceae bacterium]|nr:MarR family transcriptional regulator [Hyphomonadaceae bacterium]
MTPQSRNVEPDIVRACRRLHAAIDALDHHAATALGIPRNDLRCLNLLEHGALSPTRIASDLGLTSGAVTALVDRLEKRGLVTRARDMADRRGVVVGATPLVFARLGPIYRAYAEALTAITGAYDAEELRAACRHLDDASRACEAVLGKVD